MTTVELLAEALHITWIGWTKQVMETEQNLSQDRVERWKRLSVPYSQLTEEQKEQDCVHARKILNAMGMNETLLKAQAWDRLHGS